MVGLMILNGSTCSNESFHVSGEIVDLNFVERHVVFVVVSVGSSPTFEETCAGDVVDA
jgi:hypothetical protein